MMQVLLLPLLPLLLLPSKSRSALRTTCSQCFAGSDVTDIVSLVHALDQLGRIMMVPLAAIASAVKLDGSETCVAPLRSIE